MAPTDPPEPTSIDDIDSRFADERLTAMGLLVETHSAIMDRIETDLAEGGLAGSAFEVMIRLCRSPERRLRMSELAAQSTLTTSGLTRVVDRLEQAGLVIRRPCEHDRRGFWAQATDAGVARVAEILPSHLATIDSVFTGILRPHELDAFLTALRKIRSVMHPSADPTVSARLTDP